MATVNAMLENGEPRNGNMVVAENEAEDSSPTLDIVISNVVCSFSVRCHLDLKKIALSGCNVEYKREQGMVTMRLRNPYTTATIWSSGKLTCTGATSEENSKIAARKYARILQKLGFRVHFTNFRVVNVLGSCSLPFAIRLVALSQAHREVSYEPELHPGATYKILDPKATIKIFSTGSVTVTAPSVMNVQLAIEHVYPLVYEYRKALSEVTAEEKTRVTSRVAYKNSNKLTERRGGIRDPYDDSSDEDTDDMEQNFDSEESWE